MKKIKLMLFIVLAIICTSLNIAFATDETTTDADLNASTEIMNMIEEENNRIQETIVEVSYEYKADTNTVIATMTSNNELQNTKTTWKLSEDKKQYTFEFNANTTYMSSVVDIYGNIIPVQINVTQVDEKGPEVNIDYQYNEDNTLCTIVVTSNEEMIQKTTPGWELSEDKKVYTYIAKTNDYIVTNFTDKYANYTQVQITIDKIDERPANIEVTYEYNSETNTVIATMTADRELQNTKTTWKLSEDKKQYTFEFNANTTYMSSVVDIYGNVVPVQISVTQIDDKGPEINIEYIFNENKTQCTVQVTSNEEMIQKTTPGWKLSEDKKVYTYLSNKNEYIITNFTDKYGNFTQVTINIFFELNGIDVSRHQGKIDWEAVKASGQVDFAIIRCGYGQDRTSQDDEWFEYNVSECERLGIPYGVYLYSYAVDLNCANSEADHVLRLIKGKNPTYGIWYDLEEEVDEFGTPIPNEMLVNIAITFCEKMKANGYDYVGIYANLNWFETKLNDSRLDQYPKWVAQWKNECTYEKDYDMWQYTSSGQVPGIDGRVDMNKYYKQR